MCDYADQLAGAKRKAEDSINAMDLADDADSVEPPPKLFKLNHDCFESVFEWLSLKDLLVIRRTCKQLKNMFDLYVKLNYPQAVRVNIYTNRRLAELSELKLDYFHWIKHLTISRLELTSTQIDGLKYILNQLETLELHLVKVDGEFHEALLKHCPLLKHLCITTCTLPSTIIGTGNEWLNRQYPTLNHVEIAVNMPEEKSTACPELFKFLTLNRNVQHLAVDAEFFLDNRDNVLGSMIKLDRLQIILNRNSRENFKDTVASVCSLTNDLLVENFFKRLHLNTCFDEKHISDIAAFGNIEKLQLNSLAERFVMPVVETIKELSVGTLGHYGSEQLALTAANLTNLKQFEIKLAEIRDIKPFVCRAPKLERILVWRFYNCNELTVDDLIALDDERSCLGFARKVTIFVEEKCYLKFKFEERTNKFEFIELKNIETCKIDRLTY